MPAFFTWIEPVVPDFFEVTIMSKLSIVTILATPPVVIGLSQPSGAMASDGCTAVTSLTTKTSAARQDCPRPHTERHVRMPAHRVRTGRRSKENEGKSEPKHSGFTEAVRELAQLVLQGLRIRHDLAHMDGHSDQMPESANAQRDFKSID
jgi:hypothetical protein